MAVDIFNVIFDIFIIIFWRYKACKVSEIKGEGHSFKYGEKQNEWSTEFPECGGKRQSPIFIRSKKSIPIGIPGLEFTNYHNVLPGVLTLQNNCHTVEMKLNTSSKSEIYTPYVFGAMLKNEYVFVNVHFHWGSKNNRGSEHTIDAIVYPMEMHLVHKNKNYSSIEEAVKQPDGLLVLTIFFELREKEFKPLNYVIDKLKDVKKCGLSTTVDNFELGTFLPQDVEMFYTYPGSLTTPSCNEAVTWIVFPDPILVANRQLKEFRTLRDDEDCPLVNNFRRYQQLGDRKVYKRVPNKNPRHYRRNVKKLRNEFYCNAK